MLFDIRSGKRRRVIQVVFSFLAVLFAVSFVGFGIGGDVSINPADLFSGGDNTSDRYEQDIEDAEAALAEDPRDEQALVDLAVAHALTGQDELTADEQGQTQVTEEASASFDQALDAWERYLALEPKRIDADAADRLVQTYVLVGDYGGAAATQEQLADANPTTQNLYTYAYYSYVDLDLKQGDEAAERAIASAQGGEKKQLERQLDSLAQQATKYEQQLARQEGEGQGAGTEAIEDPFGGLSGGGGTAPPLPAE